MQYETIERFISHAHLLANAILSRDFFQDAEIYDDQAVLTYVIPNQYSCYELLNELDDSMEMVILYHVIPTDATIHGEQCCAYSDPTADHIFKINGITDDTGKCDTLYVTIYDSLEELGTEVQLELEEQLTHNSDIVFARPMREVLRDFIR
jgi:hypothetical protein